MISVRIALAFWLIPLFVAFAFAVRIHNSSHSISIEPSILHSPVPESGKVPTQKKDPNEDAVIQSLKAEIQGLEQRVKKREQVLAQRKKEQRATEPSSLNHLGLDPEQWSNKGYGTPYESVETLISSAANGDLQTMMESLVLSPESEVLAKRLFESLPTSVRKEQGNLEVIVAMMTIDQVPLTHAKVTAFKNITDEAKEVYMLFTSNLESPQPVKLDLIQLPDATWKVLVPTQAIHEYANKLGIPLQHRISD